MNRITRSIFVVLALVLLLLSAVLTLSLIMPGQAMPVEAPDTVFSAGRALQDIAVISREPHPMGVSQAHADVRDYLIGEIRALGLDPQLQETFGVRLVEPGEIIAGVVENILVRLPGRDPDGAILLMGHYDSTPGAPGAADNGSGVAILLGILRAVSASQSLRQDLIFFFTDGEEPGTIGAHAFVDQHPWFEQVMLAINMDGYKEGPTILVRTSGGNGLWVDALARSSSKPAHVALPFHLFPSGDGDMLPFRLAGVPGADIVTSASFTEAHTMVDTLEIIDPGSLQRAGDELLALTRDLGDRPLPAADIPEQTFFPVLGVLVHYPSSWAVPLAVIAGLFFIGSVFYGLRRKALHWKGLLLGTMVFLLAVLLSIALINLVWSAVQALHPGYAYSHYRPHMTDDHLYALGFLFLSLSVFSVFTLLLHDRISTLDLAAGSLVVWFLGALGAAIVLPASSYLVTWVLLVGSLSLLVTILARSSRRGELISWAAFLSLAIAGITLWVPVIVVAFQGSSFLQLALLVGTFAMLLGAMLPVLDMITRSTRWLVPLAAMLVGLGFLVAGNFLVARDSPPPLVNSIGYWLDADSQQAHWVAFIGGERVDARFASSRLAAFPDQMDERQRRLLVDPLSQDYQELFPAAPKFSVLTGAATAIQLVGPQLEVIDDAWSGDRRLIRVRVVSSMHDRVYLIIPDGSALLAVTVPGNEKTELPPVGDGQWMLRFDGVPLDGFELELEIGSRGVLPLYLVEERTGLPAFPGLDLETQPGTMLSPGEFSQGVPGDFTAMYRDFELAALGE